jgi:hypothetical protein
MEEVMSHVVADVTKNTSTIYQNCHIPVVIEDGMCEFVEWSGKD